MHSEWVVHVLGIVDDELLLFASCGCDGFEGMGRGRKEGQSREKERREEVHSDVDWSGGVWYEECMRRWSMDEDSSEAS